MEHRRPCKDMGGFLFSASIAKIFNISPLVKPVTAGAFDNCNDGGETNAANIKTNF